MDDEAQPQAAPEAYDKKLVRSARVNALGTIAKALHPAFFLLATRLFGPTAFGVYMVATGLYEILASIATAGLKDGIVVFAGRGDPDRDADHRARVNRLLANAFVLGVLGCTIVAAVTIVAGDAAVRAIFSLNAEAKASGQQVAELLPIVAWALPCMAIADISIAGTRALLIMEYDTAILGFAKPALLCTTAIVGVFVSPAATTLAWGFLATHAVLAVLGMWALLRHFSLAEIGGAILHFRFDRGLLGFAIPQSLNSTLNNFITNVDQLLLAYFGVAPAMIAFYGTAAKLIRNVRQAKLAFSGAFAPFVARLYGERRIAELEERAATVARWSTTIAMPALLAIIGLRRELLLVFDASYTHDSSFVLWLAVPPLLSCAFGLAGNVIVMTGHSRWNLLNAILTAVTTVALAFAFIPRWGLVGAAAATALSSLVVSGLQVVEVKRLVGVGVAMGLLYKPLVAGAVGGLALAGLHLVLPDAGWAHVVAALVAVATYVLVLIVQGIDPQDRRLFALRRKR